MFDFSYIVLTFVDESGTFSDLSTLVSSFFASLLTRVKMVIV